MTFTRKYEIKKSPKPAMRWEDYEQYLRRQFKSLLDKYSSSETHFQKFFEENPCMLPGAFSLTLKSGHYPFAGTVITQPDLTGLASKIPDFMWIACDSGTIYPILIEIEAPSKKYFTKKGKTTEKFNQAHDQLAEWKAWFGHGNNQQVFFDLYQIPSSFSRGKRIRPLYVLIYGRRDEFQQDIILSEKRSQLSRDDEFIMSYDRLSPEYDAYPLLCSIVKQGKYIAKYVPPTLELGPNLAEYHSLIENKEKAVEINRLISQERKDFLAARIPYWDKYGRLESKGLIHSGDRE